MLPSPLGPLQRADDTNSVANYPHPYGNGAFGGALYISGSSHDIGRSIEFTLGMNDSIRLGLNQTFQNPNNIGSSPTSTSAHKDYIVFQSNSAQNYQSSRNSEGARGGAIYIGKYTSVIIAGEFFDNYTDAK